MRIRGFAASVGAVLVLVGLAACVAAPPHDLARTQPDQVERLAVSVAAAAAGSVTGSFSGESRWVQLWTPNQAGPVIERCVQDTSHGVLTAQVSPPGQGGGRAVSYGVGVVGDAHEPLTQYYSRLRNAAEVVQRCVAATPVDDRRLLVPVRDRPALYSYDVTVLRRCLIEHGHPVGAVPARSRYENLIRASAPWSPYDHVTVSSRAAWYALSDACPALPNAIAGDVASLTTSATTP